MYRWGRFYFTEESIKTDFLLYKDRGYLALPSEGEENRFLVHSDDSRIEFYVGSSSETNFRTLQKFFEKLYNCYIREETPERIEADTSIVLKNGKPFRKSGFSFFPGFVRNVIYLPSSVPDLTLQYEVIVKSGIRPLSRRKQFNFCAVVRSRMEGANPDTVPDYVKGEITRLREEKKWRLKPVRGRKASFRLDVFRDPLILSNFMRIPEDEGSAD